MLSQRIKVNSSIPAFTSQDSDRKLINLVAKIKGLSPLKLPPPQNPDFMLDSGLIPTVLSAQAGVRQSLEVVLIFNVFQLMRLKESFLLKEET